MRSIKLTSRDLRLLKRLATYGVLSTQQIGTHVFGEIATTTVLRRLRMLEHKDYLKRIPGLETHELLWSLTPHGARTVRMPLPKRHWSKNMLEHDHKLVTLRLAMEGCGIAHSWMPEHEIRSTVFKKYGFRGIKERLVPDGFMGIEVMGRKESVAIELELTLKNKVRLRRTIMRYLEKSGLHAVWYVTPNKSILNSVFRQWQFCGGLKSGIEFYGSILNEVLENPLLVKLRALKSQEIGKTWNVKANFLPAQEVSRQKPTEEKNFIETRTENHAPNVEKAS